MAEEEKSMKELQQAQQPQAFVLQQPNGEKIYFDIQHSTDWIVVISIFVSAIISFIGFLITIYVVRYSTKVQIQSNKDLTQSQNELMMKDKKIDLSIKIQENLKHHARNYVDLHNNYAFYYLILAQQLKEFSFSRTSRAGSIEHEYITEMTTKLADANSSYTKLKSELNFYFDQEVIQELFKKMNEAFQITLNLRKLMIDNDREHITDMCIELRAIIEIIDFSITTCLKEDSILYENTKPTV